jgi:hypothetical protein
MSFTYNKRMSNYQAMLPLTPNNYRVARHTIRGGDLTTPAPATPATPALPETVQDWQNISTADIQKLTVADINNLSEASFNIFYKLNDPLSDSLWNKLMTGNPNKDLLSTAVHQRYELIQWWIPETDPLWKTDLIGVPKFWFKHYNQYSWVKSQVIMYGTYEDFQDTTFYKKYSSRIISIKPPKKFGRYMNSEIPGQERNSMGAASSEEYLNNIYEKYGQKWRVMFNQGDLSGHLSSGNDYYVYYIDCTGLPEYLDMLNDFYDDRDTLQPYEVIAMLHLQYLAAVKQHERDLVAQGYSEGESAQKAADEAAAETSEDNSSDVWGDIKDGLEIGAMFI